MGLQPGVALYLWLILITAMLAQQKELRLEDAALRWKTDLAPQTLRQLQWIGDTEAFSYIDDVNSVETLFVEDAAKVKQRLALREEGRCVVGFVAAAQITKTSQQKRIRKRP